MAPANLSAKKAISFWAKGDGKPASIMLFFQANGYTPARKHSRPRTSGSTSASPLTDFDGCDGSGLMGVFIGGSVEAGPFSFQIDDVRFE